MCGALESIPLYTAEGEDADYDHVIHNYTWFHASFLFLFCEREILLFFLGGVSFPPFMNTHSTHTAITRSDDVALINESRATLGLSVRRS